MVILGLPPAFKIALAIFNDCCGKTTLSADPWKIQIATFFAKFSTELGSPSPQIGVAAANISGLAFKIEKVPSPPIERPLT